MPFFQDTGHQDDIFLWPDDVWHYRSDWENGKVSGRSDDFVVVPTNHEKYDGVSEGSISYDEVCNSRLSLQLKVPQQREPWLPTNKEIDQALVADTLKPLASQEIKDLAAKPPVHRGKDRGLDR